MTPVPPVRVIFNPLAVRNTRSWFGSGQSPLHTQTYGPRRADLADLERSNDIQAVTDVPISRGTQNIVERANSSVDPRESLVENLSCACPPL